MLYVMPCYLFFIFCFMSCRLQLLPTSLYPLLYSAYTSKKVDMRIFIAQYSNVIKLLQIIKGTSCLLQTLLYSNVSKSQCSCYCFAPITPIYTSNQYHPPIGEWHKCDVGNECLFHGEAIDFIAYVPSLLNYFSRCIQFL